jgi:hypothetical protein
MIDETKRWRQVPGPWSKEPDAIEWQTEAGFAGALRRVPWSGHLCGYIGVPAGHLWHGRSSSSIDADVHGGLTFATLGSDTKDLIPSELWWIGFDCAHSGDSSPLDEAQYQSMSGGAYRDVEYVRYEVERLAKQAAEFDGCAFLETEIEALEREAEELRESIEVRRARLAFLRGADLSPALSASPRKEATGE